MMGSPASSDSSPLGRTRDLVPVGNQLWVAEFDDDTVSSYRMERR